jgi:AcrR family transcriptional regulator
VTVFGHGGGSTVREVAVADAAQKGTRRPMRSDTARNRRALVHAAGRLFAATTDPVTMAESAREVEVSTATAYRQFTSVEEVLSAFRYSVGLELREYAETLTGPGTERLLAVSRRWVDLVVEHGRAMVGHRSPQGYLERLRSGVEYLTVQADALAEPLAETAVQMGLPNLGDEALFLWNVLFDPREILDLVDTVGLSPTQTAERLTATLRGALAGWAQQRGASEDPPPAAPAPDGVRAGATVKRSTSRSA